MRRGCKSGAERTTALELSSASPRPAGGKLVADNGPSHRQGGDLTSLSTDLVAFSEKLLAVLDRGSFTSTYKYAVLLGLLDVALEATQRDGAPPTGVTTHQLAERVTELYWPHTRLFPATASVLGQNAGGNAEIISQIEWFRTADPARTTFHRGRASAPTAFAKLIREVEWKLVEMPLPRLQFVGNALIPFLYAISWDVRIKRSEFTGPDFDNQIRFLPGSAENLVRLAGLLRPLIQREWAAQIARLNQLPDARLEDFLFGADRLALATLRDPLVELQHGACFYCDAPLKGATIEVDHFVPWARHPNDAIENLVAAHSSCNGAKSDHLAATGHVVRWVERSETDANLLAEIATTKSWRSELQTSLSVARGIYLRIPDDTRLWQGGKSFETARHARLVEVFS
jgi:5-methylcytosine-specific restriction endonuclease McrA